MLLVKSSTTGLKQTNKLEFPHWLFFLFVLFVCFLLLVINTHTMANFKLPIQKSLNTDHEVELRAGARLADWPETASGHADH